MPWDPTTTRSVAMAALFFVSRGTLKQRAHLDLISSLHPPSKSLAVSTTDILDSKNDSQYRAVHDVLFPMYIVNWKKLR